MLDKYDYAVSRRAKCPMPLLAKHIIITSCMEPKHVYHNLSKRDSLDQLYRRITIIKLDTAYDEHADETQKYPDK